MDNDCMLECGPDKTCHIDTCCANRKSKILAPGGDEDVTVVRQRVNNHCGDSGGDAAVLVQCADSTLQNVTVSDCNRR